MSEFQPFPGAALDRCGLNRHAVFDLADLPDEVVDSIVDGTAGSRQLMLIGHGGRALWEAVKKSGAAGADPIDDFTVRTIRQWMSESLPDKRYAILYPGSDTIDLQRLGALAGWHHAAPFMVGIDAEWGTWYAYRAVVLADTHFAPSKAVDRIHPCTTCQTRPCIAACPAQAMADGGFSLARCAAYRTQPDSACAFTCLARLACPVGSDHRYDADQLRHSYSISLQTLRDQQ